MKRLLRILLPALLIATIGVACQTVHTTGAGASGVQRGQSMLIPAAEIEQASAEEYSRVMAEAGRKNALNRNRAQVARVRGITDRLIAQAPVFRTDARNWNWEVNVITSDELNAWCMAGGKMAIYTGLIDQLRLSDDEIAAVMGHEIAHALREHARERVSRAMATNLGVGLLGSVLGVDSRGMDLLSTVAAVSFQLPNSRLHETEADRIGVELAARAGFDPRAAISLWQKMAQAGGGGSIEWLSTHPAHDTRQRDLREFSERVLPLYQSARPAAR